MGTASTARRAKPWTAHFAAAAALDGWNCVHCLCGDAPDSRWQPTYTDKSSLIVLIILFHNHPSGDPSPSPQDLTFTTKLLGIGEALGVEVLDHIIVTTNSFLSFKQRALL